LRRLIAILITMVAGLLGALGTPTPASAAACSDPSFRTSDPNGMWSRGKYVVHNNMWNASGYNVSETLAACSHRNWYVTAKADNSAGDGAVKTYPNVHQDFHDWGTGAEPRLSSFSKIRSSWSARTPRVGIYNAAYDIWLNGVPGNREIMIWTDNYRQVPAGTKFAKVSLSGRTWRVYATGDNNYIAFVPTRRLTHGTLNLKVMLNWLVTKGRVQSNATLGQICFGFEIVSTGGRAARFKVNDFAISTARK